MVPKPIKVDEKEIREWADSSRLQYASQDVKGERLRLWVTAGGSYEVTYGDKTLYSGSNLKIAVMYHNDVIDGR